MRGINKVIVSGNVVGAANSVKSSSSVRATTFLIASDQVRNGVTITAWVRVNVYIEQLVRACSSKLCKGGYVLVEGELMNREGKYGRLMEVRAKEIVFVKNPGG